MKESAQKDKKAQQESDPNVIKEKDEEEESLVSSCDDQ